MGQGSDPDDSTPIKGYLATHGNGAKSGNYASIKPMTISLTIVLKMSDNQSSGSPMHFGLFYGQ